MKKDPGVDKVVKKMKVLVDQKGEVCSVFIHSFNVNFYNCKETRSGTAENVVHLTMEVEVQEDKLENDHFVS